MVTDVERLKGEMISLCGAGGVCEAMKTDLLLAGLRINFNQRAPLAGFITPVLRFGIVRVQLDFSFLFHEKYTKNSTLILIKERRSAF